LPLFGRGHPAHLLSATAPKHGDRGAGPGAMRIVWSTPEDECLYHSCRARYADPRTDTRVRQLRPEGLEAGSTHLRPTSSLPQRREAASGPAWVASRPSRRPTFRRLPR
jgi:hypothetical protein